jgi:hypothetical protein
LTFGLLANLKPRSVLTSIIDLVFVAVRGIISPDSPPWREFKLLKREEVYTLDPTMFKRRYLKRYYS